MRAIDALHLEHPFAGSRMLQGLLGADDASGEVSYRVHVGNTERAVRESEIRT
jgi:putative transposase